MPSEPLEFAGKGLRTVEVAANPGYFRVKYNKCDRSDKKPENDGITLTEALNRLGGKPVFVWF
jgi:hypothetical protein